MKVAIPRFNNQIAPCFEHAATISIVAIEGRVPVSRVDFSIQSDVALDRIRLLRDQEVTVLICGGIQDVFEDMVRAAGITVISWATGDVDDLLTMFLNGKLAAGTFSPRRENGSSSAIDT